MDIGAVCVRFPETADARDTVQHAATKMAASEVGALIVAGEEGLPEGILTDRDIVVRCVAEGLAPEDTPVRDVMTESITTVFESDSVDAALQLMADQEVRRLVVVNAAGRVVGIVTLDDLLGRIVDQAGEVGRLLKGQVRV